MKTTQARRILYVDHTARWSGGEISLSRLLSALDRQQFEPIVALGEEGPLADRLREMGIETHILLLDDGVRETRKDSLGLGGIAKKVIRGGPAVFAYARRIANLAKEKDALLIHCNSLKSDIYGAVAGRMAKRPVIWHIRDFIDPTYLPRMTVTGFRGAARILPSYVLANSKATLDCLFPTAREQRRSAVIHNGLSERDLLFEKPAPYTDWSGRKTVRIGLVGRLTRWKGQHILVEAALALLADQRAGRLPASVPPLQFVIAGGALFGEEEYEREVKKQSEPAGESIQWLGMVKDVTSLLQSLDIMVHTSVTPEPFGQVVIEGMAAGLPVIATAGGGIPEIVDEGRTGTLVPMGDAGALAAAIRSLLLDPVLASGIAQAGYKEARDRFTARHTAAAVETVYRRIADGDFRAVSATNRSAAAID